jgi:hypothetical protein
MGLRVMRGTAFVLALAISAPVLAQGGGGRTGDLLRPSPRALAAADEPPPHVDPLAPKRPVPAQVVVQLDDAPVYKKWWFWVMTAAVIGGTVAFGALTFKPAEPHPRACPITTLVCFGDGRAQ